MKKSIMCLLLCFAFVMTSVPMAFAVEEASISLSGDCFLKDVEGYTTPKESVITITNTGSVDMERIKFTPVTQSMGVTELGVSINGAHNGEEIIFTDTTLGVGESTTFTLSYIENLPAGGYGVSGYFSYQSETGWTQLQNSSFGVKIIGKGLWDISESQDGSVMAAYDISTKTITISGNGKMKNFANTSDRPYEDYVNWAEAGLENVVIEEDVTNVGGYAFSNCDKIKTITLKAYPATFNTTSFSNMGSSVTEEKFAYIDTRNTELKAALEKLGYTIVETNVGPWDISVAQDGSVMATFTEDGTMTISGNGVMMDFIDSEDNTITPVYINHIDKIKKVVVDEGVSNIGKGAFVDFTSLEYVKLPESVSYLGEGIFFDCPKVKTFIWNATPATFEKDEDNTLQSGSAFGYKDNAETNFLMGSAVVGEKIAYINSENVELKAKLEELGYIIKSGKSEVLDISTSDDNSITATIEDNTLNINGIGEVGTDAATTLSPYKEKVTNVVIGEEVDNLSDNLLKDFTKVDTFTWETPNATLGTDSLANMGSAVEGKKVANIKDGNPELENTLKGLGYTINKEHGSNEGENTQIVVDAEITTFKVTVPIKVKASMNKDGSISTAIDSSYKVENQCALGPVIISDVKVNPATGWKIADYDADFANMKASSKVIGVSVNGAKANAEGEITMNDSLTSAILHKGYKELDFQLKLPAQKEALNEVAAGVIFTVGFDTI